MVPNVWYFLAAWEGGEGEQANWARKSFPSLRCARLIITCRYPPCTESIIGVTRRQSARGSVPEMMNQLNFQKYLSAHRGMYPAVLHETRECKIYATAVSAPFCHLSPLFPTSLEQCSQSFGFLRSHGLVQERAGCRFSCWWSSCRLIGVALHIGKSIFLYIFGRTLRYLWKSLCHTPSNLACDIIILLAHRATSYPLPLQRMPARKSILEYLRSDSPIVSSVHYPQDDVKLSKKGRNTTNSNYTQPKCILEWEDFEFDSLQAIYNGRLRKVLDQEISNFTDHSAVPHLPFCEIHDEDSLEALLIKWNQSVVSDALDVTQKVVWNSFS